MRLMCGRWRPAIRSLALLGCAALAAGCSSVRPWVNSPLTQAAPEAQPLSEERDPSLLVAITLSGGGARAAAFGFGVLSELRDTEFVWNGRRQNLLSATDVISGVSGGSIIAAYYAVHGPHGLARFEEDYLRRDFQRGLINLALLPASLVDLSSPWYGRSHLLAKRLDALYGGATFGDLERRPDHPQLVVMATDLSRGASFEFSWDQFRRICSDLRSVPLSFAVAASSAVPVVLSPLTLHNHAGRCPPELALPRTPPHRGTGTAQGSVMTGASYRARMYQRQAESFQDAEARPYIHLVDGGVADNLGIQRLLDRSLSDGGLSASMQHSFRLEPGTIRKLILVVVNSERDPAENIDQQDTLPGTFQVMDQLLFGAGARATQETQELLVDLTHQWRQELARAGRDGSDAFAPDAEVHVVQVNLRDVPELTKRRRLLQVATAFTVGPDEVSDLIDAGREVLRSSPSFQNLLRSLQTQRRAP